MLLRVNDKKCGELRKKSRDSSLLWDHFLEKTVAYSLSLLLIWGGTAFAYRPIEIILRQAPAEVPSAERLYLAERLYDLDRLEEAREWLESILADQAPESPEALLLLGRIEFTRGKSDKCLTCFNRLYAYYPQSGPLVSGDLSRIAFRALEILVNEQKFDQCGGYIDLLKQIDPHAVQTMANRLEKQVDNELAALQADLAKLHEEVGTPLWGVSAKELGDPKIDVVGSCPWDDRDCAQTMAEKARSYLERIKRQEQYDWDQRLSGRYEQAKAGFARRGIEAAQAHILLGRLVNDRIMREAIEPKTISGLPPPYEFTIVEEDFYRYRKGMSKYLKGGEIKMTGWRVVRRARPEALQSAGAVTMGFGALSRQQLLENLSRLLYTRSGGRVSGNTKL